MANLHSFVNNDGICMVCQQKPSSDDTVSCSNCATDWHLPCLPTTSSDSLQWNCPDCSPVNDPAVSGMESHSSITTQEKNSDAPGFNCPICERLLERPVTTPCAHHFCYKCFKAWIGDGKRNCAKCGNVIPFKMANQPRIDTKLSVAVRISKLLKTVNVNDIDHRWIQDQKQTKRSRGKFGGGKMLVTVGPDHFGPIYAENDPVRNEGVVVGETWEDRMECRRWGVHLPLVAGVAAYSSDGAQSVILSGGHEDYEDYGDWFLYTGRCVCVCVCVSYSFYLGTNHLFNIDL